MIKFNDVVDWDYAGNPIPFKVEPRFGNKGNFDENVKFSLKRARETDNRPIYIYFFSIEDGKYIGADRSRICLSLLEAKQLLKALREAPYFLNSLREVHYNQKSSDFPLWVCPAWIISFEKFGGQKEYLSDSERKIFIRRLEDIISSFEYWEEHMEEE
jgi:hypothetical protein